MLYFTFPFIRNEVVIRNLVRDKVVGRVVFDPSVLSEDELLWLFRVRKEITELLKSRGCREVRQDVDVVREVGKEVVKLLSKATKGGKSVPLDPPMRGILGVLVGAKNSRDIGMWWCDGGERGRYFTDTLCDLPNYHWTRRAVALNTWSLSDLSDLDTIIDNEGYHKEGTIGKSPFSYSVVARQREVLLIASFQAASSTTIYSLLLLIPSVLSPGCGSCSSNYPSTHGTCDPSSYCSIYMPMWGWDIEAPIEADEAYSASIRFTTP